jgi:hypothetical protein
MLFLTACSGHVCNIFICDNMSEVFSGLIIKKKPSFVSCGPMRDRNYSSQRKENINSVLFLIIQFYIF